MKKIALLLVLAMSIMTLASSVTFVSGETTDDVFAVSGVQTKIEFEDYTKGFDSSENSNTPEQSSTYVVLRSKDYVLFDVDVALAGEYKLSTSIMYPGDFAEAPVSFFSNGEFLTASKLPHSESWKVSAEQVAENTFYLGKGHQTLMFSTTTDAHFDYFVLERVGDIPEEFKSSYYFGNHSGGYDASAGNEIAVGHSGTGSISLDKDDYVYFNINVKASGEYSLNLWAGNNSQIAAGVKVYTGSELIADGSIAYSGGWTTWAENDLGTVVLGEGEATFKFLSSQVAYYKYFTLEKTGDVPANYQSRHEFELYSGGFDASVEGSTAPEKATGAIILRVNDYALYDINILSSGEYNLKTAIRYPGNVSVTPVSVYSNGEKLTTSKIPNTGTSWANATYVEQVAESTFYLGKGKQTLRFESTTDAYFNYFILERVGDIPENYTVRYECGINAGGYDASEEANVAAGVKATANVELQPGDYKLFNINVKKAGTYTLKIGGGNNDKKAAGLKVYQYSALLASGETAYSGGWTTWAENDLGTIALGEGETTLKFLSKQVAYYKYFTLERIGDIPSDKTISLVAEARETSYDDSEKKPHTTNGYLSFGKNDTVTLKANVAESGNYRVVVKAGVKTNNHSAVRLFVDDKVAVISANLINNGDWQTAESTSIGSVYLEEGMHEIYFVGLADEFWFFGADLTTEVSETAQVAQADYIVQAENFKNAVDNTEGLDDASENLIAYSPVEVVEENGGKVVCFEAGEALEYGLIGLREAGYYNVKFLMAGPIGEYSVKVGAKGGALTSADVSPAMDGSYLIVTVADVYLAKGNSDFVVEFSGFEGQVFKLDNITLYKETVTTSFNKAKGTASASVKLEGLFSGEKATATLVVYENGTAKKLVYTDYKEIDTADDFSTFSLSLSGMTFEEGKTYSAKLFIWNEEMQGNTVEITVQ